MVQGMEKRNKLLQKKIGFTGKYRVEYRVQG